MGWRVREQPRTGGAQPVLRLGWDEHQVSRAYLANAFGGFHRAFPFHDEVEVFADLVVVVRG